MNRIGKKLATLKSKGRKALACYIVNGDPRPSTTLAAMHALVESGADIIELGVPFSDPMAEGPVIQRGHERALMHGTSLTSTFALVSEFRRSNSDTPVVLMGYANPIERMGYENCAKRAAEAGVDGILTVDLPAEEAKHSHEYLKQHQLENIFLVAPTTTNQRMLQVVEIAGGFIYYVSLKGVTGAGNLDIASVKEKVSQIKEKTDLPVLVGFGIKNGESAAAVASVSDGVVVGSVLVSAMGDAEEGAEPLSDEALCEKIKAIVLPIRQALDK